VYGLIEGVSSGTWLRCMARKGWCALANDE